MALSPTPRLRSTLATLATLAAPAALAALSLLAAPRAFAETKSYNGSMCVPTDSFDASRLSLGSTTNEIKAISGTPVVACPIVKGVKNNSKLESVSVTINLTAARKVVCDLYALRADIPNTMTGTTNQVDHVSNDQTKTWPAGTSIITFPAMTGGTGDAWPSDNKFKYYEFFCGLNTNDRIISYTVNETGTDSQYTRIYPSAMCHPGHDMFGEDSRYKYIRGSSSDGGGYLQAVGEGAFTDGGAFATYCPVIGDHGTGNGGTVRARLVVAHPDVKGDKMTCGFYQSFSNLPIASKTKTVTGDGSMYPTENLDMTLPAGSNQTWSRYHFVCHAKGNGDSKILGYAIEEK